MSTPTNPASITDRVPDGARCGSCGQVHAFVDYEDLDTADEPLWLVSRADLAAHVAAEVDAALEEIQERAPLMDHTLVAWHKCVSWDDLVALLGEISLRYRRAQQAGGGSDA